MGGAYGIDWVVPVVDPGAFVHPDAVLIGDVHVAADCYVDRTRRCAATSGGSS